MPRLVEIQHAEEAPATVRLQAGDVLSVGASGGRVTSGDDVVSCLGAFLPAICATAGEVVAPMGAPSIVLFLARGPGSASIDAMAGDPWSAPRRVSIQIVVS